MKMFFGAALMMFTMISCVVAQDETEANQELNRLLASVQKFCPVSGGELGSMGDPVRVEVEGQAMFLCCAGCKGKEFNEEHLNKINARIAKAQATCPVMGKKVDADMKSAVVKGHRVFVCCPPCIAKIEGDVDGNLEKVHASYREFLKAEMQESRDQVHVSAQKICPVSGAELGSMGKPVKVKVGAEEHAFLCCKGCVGKKIDAEHWQTVQSNLASAQGTCPVMNKPVNAKMKSTVIGGRKIFVCCPPCIEKVQADPDKFLDQLDQQIKANLDSSNNPTK